MRKRPMQETVEKNPYQRDLVKRDIFERPYKNIERKDQHIYTEGPTFM